MNIDKGFLHPDLHDADEGLGLHHHALQHNGGEPYRAGESPARKL